MWKDIDLQQALIAAAVTPEPGAGDVRRAALGALQDIASLHENQEPMWGNTDLRSAVMAGATDYDPEGVRRRLHATGILRNLAGTGSVAFHMWSLTNVRQTLIEAASLPAGQEHPQIRRRIRTLALQALSRLAVVNANQQGMWEDDKGARHVAISAARLDAPEEEDIQAAGLDILDNLANSFRNLKPMWDDSSCRQAILAAAACSNALCTHSSQRALELLRKLAMEPANQQGIWHTTRQLVLAAAKLDPHEELALWTTALRILQNLASNEALGPLIWADDQAQAMLSTAAGLSGSSPHDARAAALAVMWSLASVDQNKVAIWRDTQRWRGPLLSAADSDEQPNQEYSLAALWNLATKASNRQSMWNEEQLRALLIARAQKEEGTDAKSRLFALAALHQLSTAPVNHEPIWQSQLGARTALFKAASATDVKVRAYALSSLLQLAVSKGNRGPMWRDGPGARATLVHASLMDAPSRRTSRACALSALVMLAKAPENKEPMWEDKDGARAAFLEAAGLTDLTDTSLRQSQLNGMAGLWQLSAAEANRHQMWMDQPTQHMLLTVGGLTEDSDWAHGVTYAAATLRNLAHENANKVSMWADEQGARKVLLNLADQSKLAKARTYALDALMQLASDPENQGSMWLQELHDVLNRAALESSDVAAQTYALNALQHLTAGASGSKLWGDIHGARAVLLAGAALSKPEKRHVQEASVSMLWRLAEHSSLREALWLDTDVKLSLVNAAHSTGANVHRVRNAAFAALAALSRNAWNLEQMWSESAIRKLFLHGAMLTGHENREAKAYALEALRNLAFSRANLGSIWNKDLDGNPPATLLTNAKLTNSSDQKFRDYALATLELLSLNPHNRESMWTHFANTRKRLLEAAQPSMGEAAAFAMNTLVHLSEDSANQRSMWEQVHGARAAFLAVVTDPQAWPQAPSGVAPLDVRALTALRNLAIPTENQQAMWDDPATRDALLTAAELPVTAAVQALFLLAEASGNRRSMWLDADVGRVLVGAAAKGDDAPKRDYAPEAALGAFAELAKEPLNRRAMWQDKHGVRAAVIQAAGFQQPENRHSRNHALKVLENLAIEKTNRDEMWLQESGVRDVLIAAALLTDPKDRNARLSAIIAIQKLADDAANQQEMWGGDAQRLG